ncbi:hypothetical protein [Streptomyces sp. NPDC018031]|uniref:hypothetical protein n=1 Tax=Streptomyces sp. NPDC018031 TaxID=3365033 RepID=UPI0037B270BB
MNGDEQLLNGRVYGHDHDDPDPDPGPLPHRTYAELVGGPLDGLLLDIHGWRTEEVDGVALTTELSRRRPTARQHSESRRGPRPYLGAVEVQRARPRRHPSPSASGPATV